MALETQSVLANSFEQLGQTGQETDASSQEATESISSDQLDFTDADHPLSDLDGFNVDNVNNQNTEAAQKLTTQETTTPPPGKKPSLADLDNISKKQGAMLQQQAKNVGTQFEATSRNPYMAFKAYEFDQYTSNVDRYRGYGKTTFNRLGFDPLDENEAYFNANTSNWQDFKRMTGQFSNLFGSAFISNYTTFSDFVSGQKNLTDPDAELADEFEKANRLGMSSKAGAFGFVNNLALNFAYTSGIIANIAAEEAVIAAASAAMSLTGVGVVGATALQIAEQARTASKLKKVYNAWKAGMTGARSVGQMFKGGAQMLKSLKYVDNARDFWTAARSGAAVFGRGALHFVNPFEGTTDVIKGIRAGTMGYRNLTNYAKVSKTFGGFYRDVRNGWFAVGESKMEGGGDFNDIVRDEIKIYQEKNNGAFPPQEELDKIYQRATDGGRLGTLINIPMILLSNKITLDGIFKFKGTGSIMNAAEEFGIKGAGKNFTWNLAERTFAENSLGYLKNVGKAALSPKIYLAGAANYFKANLTEGLQELGQEVTSGAIKDYYHNTYLDPSLGGSDYIQSVVYSSIGKNVFSKQGIETFASGFLMGGLSSVGGKAIKSTLTGSTELFMKVAKPEKYAAYIKNKQQAETVVLNAMNSIMADPEKFFSRKRESLVNQKKATQNMSEAEINNDDYAFHNAKDDLTFDHVFTALDSGSFGQVMGALQSYSKLSDKELADAFNLTDGVKAREKLNEYLERGDQIKEKYDYFQEKFSNPFDPRRLEKGSEEQIREFIAYKAFEDAKKAAVASQYGFERATQRMVNLFDELQKNPAIKKSSASDYTVLQSTKAIANEIKILSDEIETLKAGGTEEKKLAKKKEKKLNALEDYLSNLDIYNSEKEKITLTPDGKAVNPTNKKLLNPLGKSFKKYIKAIADLNGETYIFDDNVKSAFDKIADYYQLSDDAKSYTEIVNRLVNPEELVKYAQVIDKTLMELYDDRDFYLTQSVKNYVNIHELNGLMTALGQMGIIINPEELDDMVKMGKMPTTFFDLYKNVIIDDKDPRYTDIIEKVNTFTNLKKDDGRTQTTVQPTTPAATPQPTAQSATSPTQSTPQPTAQPSRQQPTAQPASQTTMPADLETLLRAAYDEYMLNNSQSAMTFNDYVNTSARAAGIKKDYEEKNKGTQQPAPAATPQPSTPAAQPATSKPAGIQANPENIGVNTDVIVVDDQSERPDIFEQWTDPRIIDSSAQPMLIAENIDRLVNLGKRLDQTNAPWSIGSFRAQVDGRLMVDVFAGGEHFLVYKSTGEGTGAESKGEWVPILGFAQSGWFIKTMWKGQNPKFTKYESETFKAIDKYLKEKSDSLFDDPKSNGPTEIQLAPETNVVEPTEQKYTAKEVAKMIVDSAKSLKQLPNSKLEGKSKVAQDLIALLSDVDAEISPKDVQEMLMTRKKELLKNLQLSDFEKGDLVTFTNGDKGFVTDIGKDRISVKIIGSGPGEYRDYPLSGRDPVLGDINLRNNVDMIEEKKAVPVDKIDKVEIDPQDKKEVDISKNTLAEFSSDPTKIKAAMDAAKADETNQNNINNLLKNIGCKTNI